MASKNSGQFPDPHRAAEDLQTFAKMNENRLYQLLKTCMDTQTDLKGLVKATVSNLRYRMVSLRSDICRMSSYAELNSLRQLFYQR